MQTKFFNCYYNDFVRRCGNKLYIIHEGYYKYFFQNLDKSVSLGSWGRRALGGVKGKVRDLAGRGMFI